MRCAVAFSLLSAQHITSRDEKEKSIASENVNNFSGSRNKEETNNFDSTEFLFTRKLPKAISINLINFTFNYMNHFFFDSVKLYCDYGKLVEHKNSFGKKWEKKIFCVL